MNQYDNCNDCAYAKTCPRYETCEYLIIDDTNEDDYASTLLSQLKKRVKPARTKILLPLKSSGEFSKSDRYTDYEYYKNMINDCLSQLRSGLTTYVFKEYHVAEILRFEPDINLTVKDGVYYINL